jgi:tRNA dimethylallyltransferase
MGANGGKVIAVLGPTCSGKSDLAEWLAGAVGGEIVNADSMQVYRGFDIGSAKPPAAVRKAVPHHVIDVVDPDEEFNAALFKKMADEAIHAIHACGRMPITVGGTGLYMRVLFHGLFKVPTDPGTRERLRKRYEEDPLGAYEELQQHDPAYALAISHRDKVRVVRGLEIWYLSGTPMSAWKEQHGFREQRYSVLKIGLRRERRDLYQRIDRRVEAMLEQGWVKEVEDLLNGGCDPAVKPFQSIGYREIVLYLEGKIGYSDMVEKIRTATRHYAKRQITWFSKEKDIVWYAYPEQRDSILEQVTGFLN